MKTLVRACTLLALTAFASAQSRYFWSQSQDGGFGLDDQGRDVALGSQGQVFVAAVSNNAANTDALFLAFDPYGHPLWQSRIDLGGNESGLGVAVDPAGGNLFAWGAAVATGGVVHWVVWRLDPASGAVVWQNDYFGPLLQGGTPRAFAIDSAGGVIAVGSVGVGPAQVADVARFDAAGALSWDLQLPVAGGQYGSCMQVTADPLGGALVKSAASAGGTQWTIQRVSAAGALVWSKGIGATDNGTVGLLIDSASDLLYSINLPVIGGHVIAKLDAAGNPLWSVDVSPLFGINSSTYGLAVAANRDVVASGSNGMVVRLDPNGNLIWARALPPVAWFDATASVSAGLLLGPSGDVFLRQWCHTLNFLDYDSISCWDAAGNFRWSQSLRSTEPDVEVQTLGIKIAPQGSVVIAGASGPSGGARDIFVAAVHQSSHMGCFGDGSSGPCPCGNTVGAGTASGCQAGTLGLGARLDDQGISSLGSDSLRFYAAGLPFSGVALLLQGHPGSAALPFQDGLMCLQAPLLRIYNSGFSGQWIDLAPAGAVRVAARSAALGDPIQPGTSRAYQLYFRGASSSVCQAGNGNLSNSVVVDWTP